MASPGGEEGATVTGVDVRESFVEGAKLRAEDNGAEATFLTCPAEKMPFPDSSFDVVIGLNIIEHVRSHRDTVREMTRVLCPGGHLYMDGPNRFSSEFFKKDPHYGLLAVSTFPAWLGRFYVTKIRGFPSYDVGVFPVATAIQRLMT
ncbi:class I SAM-dependent methyltransferase, partial [Candidatus Sumerlaeota bacterium]|nr:class I SAM-dependent methyltransferase [Candidatus Sumerlaeota bacterium]